MKFASNLNIVSETYQVTILKCCIVTSVASRLTSAALVLINGIRLRILILSRVVLSSLSVIPASMGTNTLDLAKSVNQLETRNLASNSTIRSLVAWSISNASSLRVPRLDNAFYAKRLAL